MAQQDQTVIIDEEKRNMSNFSFEKDHSAGITISIVDKAAERAYGTHFLPSSPRPTASANTLSPQTRFLPPTVPLPHVFLQLSRPQ